MHVGAVADLEILYSLGEQSSITNQSFAKFQSFLRKIIARAKESTDYSGYFMHEVPDLIHS
jgi:hypothetical protein